MSRWPGNANREKTTFGGLFRGALMSRVRSSGNATTELKLVAIFRKAGITGWRRGYPLLGKPDFTFPLQRVVVFVDGCFWHGHSCGRNLQPKTNSDVWRVKIQANKSRDRRVSRALRKKGWTVIRIWECSLVKMPNACLRRIVRVLN